MFVYYSYVYLELFVYFILVIGICSIMIGLCYMISENNQYFEKGIGYECGFDPFSDARDPFNIKFYLISILFIIFDVEIVFFFPWVLCLKQVAFFGFITMYIFVFLLIVGFLYEWRKGCLEWT